MTTQEKTMLYLTDLPYGIGILDIQDFLSQYKDSIVKIITPEMSQRNITKGSFVIKVLFKDNESADKCRKEMNLRKFRKKSVRIMWEERDTSLRYNTKNNIYIKGIPKTTTPREVYEYFSQFGDIFSCKVAEDDYGNHYGYGYITFYSHEDAEKAISQSQGKTIFDSNNVEISHFQKRNERMINNNENNKDKIYINNLPEKYEVSELNTLCKEYGKVETCNIYLDKIGKNFGIVKFSNESEAQEAKAKLDGKEIEKDGVKTKLIVKSYQTQFEQKQYMMNYYSLKSTEKKGNCNLLLKNIPLTAKEEDLEKIFSKYGVITSTRIEKNKIEKKEEKGKFELVSKGYGFISFEKPEDAKKALEEMDQKFLPGFEGWNKPLTIENYLTKKERQLVENQDMNISNYYMGAAPTPQQHFVPQIPPHFMPYQFQPNAHGPMFPPMPMQMRYPMIQFNNYNNYGQYNNYSNNYNNNFYNNNKRRGQKRFYNKNNNNNNNRNYYKNQNNNNNKYNKDKNDKDRLAKEEKELQIDIEKNIDMDEYDKLETEEDKKNYFGEKIYNAIEESQLAVDKKLDSDDIAKITGMIINIPNDEIIKTMQNSSLFNNRIKEALHLLNK